jgi:hypothetical protein
MVRKPFVAKALSNIGQEPIRISLGPNAPEFEIDGRSDHWQNYGMGQAHRPTCPNCGAYLILALPPGGKGAAHVPLLRLRWA